MLWLIVMGITARIEIMRREARPPELADKKS